MEETTDPTTNSNKSHPSDSDDLTLFYSRDYSGLSRKIIRIKHNDPDVTTLSMYSIDDLNERAWKRLGKILGENTNVVSLSIFYGHPDVAGLCAGADGLQRNRCIRNFGLRGLDLRNADNMSILAPFLSDNPSLEDITLRSCHIGGGSMNIISNALSNRATTANTLEKLNLSGNYLVDNDLNELIQSLDGGRNFKSLWLADNLIGRGGCTLLARLLQSQESNMESLHLKSNNMDNQSAIILADSLANNTKLKELTLGGNTITSGWAAILHLVCDTSSIRTAKASNHTLNDLGMHYSVVDLAAVERALGVDDANLLHAALILNATDEKWLVMRRKILWSHARGNLNLGDCFIANGAMPWILAWIGDDSTEASASVVQYHEPPLVAERVGAIRLDSVYRILQHMPDLCKTHDAVSGRISSGRGVKRTLSEIVS